MTDSINKVAVLGAGVMGAGIAAHFANAGVPVLLLDIVPEGTAADKRNILAEGAVAKLLKSKPAAFAHKKCAKLIECGNMEDDLNKLKEVDWIVEVVLEDLEVKQSVYRKIDKVRKQGSIVSSNTSTLPLSALTRGMSDEFCRDFMITHFFNPPRYMRLLEVTGGSKTDAAKVEMINNFADIRLGKGVVMCKDTPGFLANRIGIFWLMTGLLEAIELGISVEDADAVMGRPLGIPKTGVFGLFDLIGIDLMPLIAKAMMATLPEKDRFRTMYDEPEIVKKMIADGYTGRKGKGGFYRLNRSNGKKVKEAINLQNGEYSVATKSSLASVRAAKKGIQEMLSVGDIGSKYAYNVLVNTLHYAASLIPEISDDIKSVDDAMKLGYNWKYGPFELIDRLSSKDKSGAQWLAEQCQEKGLPVPEIVAKLIDKSGADRARFYTEDSDAAYRFNIFNAVHEKIVVPKGKWSLHDKKRGRKPVAKNASCALWDLGDGILGFEFTSKMNSIDPEIMSMLNKSIDIVRRDFRGLVIGSDADRFSVGANLGFFMYVANLAAWPMLSDVIRQGQDTYMALKYAPFPVVSALSGLALGGGAELVLHSDAVAAHIESYIGLVEVGVGVIPGWGGCKEMLFRHDAMQKNVAAQIAAGKRPEVLLPSGPMPVISKVFEYIAMAKVAESALEAQEMLFLGDKSRVVMNRSRVLPIAKEICLELAEEYSPPERRVIHLAGKTAKTALDLAIEGFVASGKASPHDKVVAEHLAVVLSGGDADIIDDITEQDILDLEHDMFMELVKTKPTMERIEYMLENNKPLRN